MKTSIMIIGALVVQVFLLFSCPAQSAENRMYTSWFTYEPTLEDRLRTAAYRGDLEDISRLISKGARIDSSDIDGWTPLIEAVTSDQPEAVSFLLKRGADVNARGKKTGHTALSWSAVLGYTHIMEILVEAGADLEVRNKRGRTPLMESSLRGHAATTELLLAKGANPNAKDRRGRSALAFAAYGAHGEVVSVLLAKGAQADGTAKKLLSRAGLVHHPSLRAASAGSERQTCRLNASPVYCAKRTRYSEMYSSGLRRIREARRSSVLQTAASTSRNFVTGNLEETPGMPGHLEELTAIAIARSAGLSRNSGSRDYQNLRRLADQATSIWAQLQSNHPEVAAALRARMPDMTRLIRP